MIMMSRAPAKIGWLLDRHLKIALILRFQRFRTTALPMRFETTTANRTSAFFPPCTPFGVSRMTAVTNFPLRRLPFLVNSIKSASFLRRIDLGKPCAFLASGKSLFSSNADDQALTSVPTTGVQCFSTTFGRHALTKPMFTFTTFIAWLICPLHK